MQLQVLGGLQLTSTSLNHPKLLLLLTYLALEGTQQRKHLAALFWQDGNRLKNLSMSFTRLRQSAGEVIQVDAKQAKITIPSDVTALLEALDKSDWEAATRLYTGAFLEGVVLDDWNSELEEWVYKTREYLAERVQFALLNLAEHAAKKQEFETAAKFAERAYKLPGLGGTEVANLKRLYLLLCAGSSLLAPSVRKEAESYGVTLQLTSEEAKTIFQQESKVSNILPMRGTSFVGRDVELTELATVLNKHDVSLLTLLGTAGVGKTRLALQLAHEQQKLGAFKDGVYFVSLEALNDASLIASTLLSHLSLGQQGKTEPLQQLADFFADKSVLLVLDNFEHLTDGAVLLSHVLSKCPNLKLLVTSRETLKLEEEHVFTLEGLPFATMPTGNATLSDAVQLFNERAQQVQPRFEVDQHLTDVIRICGLVEGLPLGIELAASWVRLMSCQDIASEIERGLELLTSVAKNVSERHRSLKAAFEQSWKLLTPKEQEVLRNLSVFVGGFRRETASEVAGATIPILASLVDKSLLRVLPNGRYDRHPLLYQFTKEKLLEKSNDQLNARENHARYYLAFTELADVQLQGKDQVMWFGRLDEELDNLHEALRYLQDNDAATALRFASTLGYFWKTRGYYTEGANYLTTLLNKTSEPNFTRAKAMLHAGWLSFEQGDYQQARVCFEESVDIAKHLEATAIWAEALMSLGQVSYHNQGDAKGARSRYEASLELARKSGDKPTLARLLYVLGAFEQEQANYQQAKTWLTEAETLFTELENKTSQARVLNSLANIWVDLGESDKARLPRLQSLELAKAVSDRFMIGIVLLNLGNDVSWQDDEQKATAYYEESLHMFRELGNKRMVSYVLINLGNSFYRQADLSKAQALMEESLAVQRAIGETGRVADVLRSLGNVSYQQGDWETAYRYYQESLTVCREQDDTWATIRVLNALADWHIAKRDYPTACRALKEATELAHTTSDKPALISLFETQASLETLAGEATRAVQLFAHVEVMRQQTSLVRNARDHREVEKQLSSLREHLGKKGFAEAWSQGKAVELSQALELVLGNSSPGPQQGTTLNRQLATSLAK